MNKDRRDEQKLLKEICRQIKNKHNINFVPELFNDRMGLGVSQFYESSLNKGNASEEKVAKIKDWITVHELELAHEIAPLLFPQSKRTGWQAFIEERGAYSGLLIKPFKVTSLHEISALHPISETRIKLGQQFTFELDSPISGAVLALDYYKGQWYPMPLRHDGGLEPIAIMNGFYGFPMNTETKAVVPMRQRAFGGEHGHCFMVGPQDLMMYYARGFKAGDVIKPKTLNDMAERLNKLEDHQLSIHMENVIFE